MSTKLLRALIVGGAPVVDASDFSELIGTAELIIAVDSGAELCRAHDRWPDHLVGDLDSITRETLQMTESAGTETHRLERDKDFSDLDAAFGLAEKLSVARPLTVTAITRGREDHLLAVYGSLARHASLSPVIDEPHLAGWILSAEGSATLSIAPQGALFSVIALGGPARVSIEGARFPLNRVVLGPLSSHGISNLVDADSAQISVHEGTAIVLCPRVADRPHPIADEIEFA